MYITSVRLYTFYPLNVLYGMLIVNTYFCKMLHFVTNRSKCIMRIIHQEKIKIHVDIMQEIQHTQRPTTHKSTAYENEIKVIKTWNFKQITHKDMVQKQEIIRISHWNGQLRISRRPNRFICVHVYSRNHMSKLKWHSFMQWFASFVMLMFFCHVNGSGANKQGLNPYW